MTAAVKLHELLDDGSDDAMLARLRDLSSQERAEMECDLDGLDLIARRLRKVASSPVALDARITLASEIGRLCWTAIENDALMAHVAKSSIVHSVCKLLSQWTAQLRAEPDTDPPGDVSGLLATLSDLSGLKKLGKSSDTSASSAWLALSKRAVAALSDVMLEWRHYPPSVLRDASGTLLDFLLGSPETARSLSAPPGQRYRASLSAAFPLCGDVATQVDLLEAAYRALRAGAAPSLCAPLGTRLAGQLSALARRPPKTVDLGRELRAFAVAFNGRAAPSAAAASVELERIRHVSADLVFECVGGGWLDISKRGLAISPSDQGDAKADEGAPAPKTPPAGSPGPADGADGGLPSASDVPLDIIDVSFSALLSARVDELPPSAAPSEADVDSPRSTSVRRHRLTLLFSTSGPAATELELTYAADALHVALQGASEVADALSKSLLNVALRNESKIAADPVEEKKEGKNSGRKVSWGTFSYRVVPLELAPPLPQPQEAVGDSQPGPAGDGDADGANDVIARDFQSVRRKLDLEAAGETGRRRASGPQSGHSCTPAAPRGAGRRSTEATRERGSDDEDDGADGEKSARNASSPSPAPRGRTLERSSLVSRQAHSADSPPSPPSRLSADALAASPDRSPARADGSAGSPSVRRKESSRADDRGPGKGNKDAKGGRSDAGKAKTVAERGPREEPSSDSDADADWSQDSEEENDENVEDVGGENNNNGGNGSGGGKKAASHPAPTARALPARRAKAVAKPIVESDEDERQGSGDGDSQDKENAAIRQLEGANAPNAVAADSGDSPSSRDSSEIESPPAAAGGDSISDEIEGSQQGGAKERKPGHPWQRQELDKRNVSDRNEGRTTTVDETSRPSGSKRPERAGPGPAPSQASQKARLNLASPPAPRRDASAAASGREVPAASLAASSISFAPARGVSARSPSPSIASPGSEAATPPLGRTGGAEPAWLDGARRAEGEGDVSVAHADPQPPVTFARRRRPKDAIGAALEEAGEHLERGGARKDTTGDSESNAGSNKTATLKSGDASAALRENAGTEKANAVAGKTKAPSPTCAPSEPPNKRPFPEAAALPPPKRKRGEHGAESSEDDVGETEAPEPPSPPVRGRGRGRGRGKGRAGRGAGAGAGAGTSGGRGGRGGRGRGRGSRGGRGRVAAHGEEGEDAHPGGPRDAALAPNEEATPPHAAGPERPAPSPPPPTPLPTPSAPSPPPAPLAPPKTTPPASVPGLVVTPASKGDVAEGPPSSGPVAPRTGTIREERRRAREPSLEAEELAEEERTRSPRSIPIEDAAQGGTGAAGNVGGSTALGGRCVATSARGGPSGATPAPPPAPSSLSAYFSSIDALPLETEDANEERGAGAPAPGAPSAETEELRRQVRELQALVREQQREREVERAHEVELARRLSLNPSDASAAPFRSHQPARPQRRLSASPSTPSEDLAFSPPYVAPAPARAPSDREESETEGGTADAIAEALRRALLRSEGVGVAQGGEGAKLGRGRRGARGARGEGDDEVTSPVRIGAGQAAHAARGWRGGATNGASRGGEGDQGRGADGERAPSAPRFAPEKPSLRPSRKLAFDRAQTWGEQGTTGSSAPQPRPSPGGDAPTGVDADVAAFFRPAAPLFPPSVSPALDRHAAHPESLLDSLARPAPPLDSLARPALPLDSLARPAPPLDSLSHPSSPPASPSSGSLPDLSFHLPTRSATPPLLSDASDCDRAAGRGPEGSSGDDEDEEGEGDLGMAQLRAALEAMASRRRARAERRCAALVEAARAELQTCMQSMQERHAQELERTLERAKREYATALRAAEADRHRAEEALRALRQAAEQRTQAAERTRHALKETTQRLEQATLELRDRQAAEMAALAAETRARLERVARDVARKRRAARKMPNVAGALAGIV